MEVQAPVPQRRPLQPKNIQCDPKLKPKLKPGKIAGNVGKENCPMGVIEPMEASLAEELGFVRRRRERLKLEREKIERVMKEKERVLERGLREMERRWEVQKIVELEIQRVLRVMQLSCCVRVAPMQSLRAKEEDKRDAQLKEPNCSEKNESEESSKEEEDANK